MKRWECPGQGKYDRKRIVKEIEGGSMTLVRDEVTLKEGEG